MNKKYDIILAIDTCVDLLLDCGSVRPVYGQAEQLVNGYSMELGGSAGIFACGAAKLGLAVGGVGVVGNDLFGGYVKEILKKNGVHTTYILEKEDIQTGVGISLCLENHDRAIMTYNGSIQEVDRSEFSEELIASSRHIHIGSYFLMKKMQDSYPSILKTAKKYGVTVSLDTNWDPEEKWDSGLLDLLPYVDIFMPNANEAMAITRKPVVEEAMKFLSASVPVVVLKEGAKGAKAYCGEQLMSAASMDAQVMDTVGAGDNFDAGFVYGYLNGNSIDECLQLGCICGSASTRQYGGIKGQIRKEDLLRLLGRDVCLNA